MTGRILLSLAWAATAFVGAGVLSGLDRRVTARLQSRMGPPLAQPFYDLLKLASKTPMASNGVVGASAGASFLAAATALALFFFQANLLLVVFVQAAVGVFLVIGALSVESPYSRVGAQRELFQMLSFEPLVLLAATSVGLVAGSFELDLILARPEPLLFKLPLVFAALTLGLTIKLRKSPFDVAASHHAHQELVRGVYTEYSGRHLALIEAAHWLEIALTLCLVWLFWADPWWAGVLLAAGVYILEIIVDNMAARLTWRWMLAVAWGAGVTLCAANLVWLAVA